MRKTLLILIMLTVLCFPVTAKQKHNFAYRVFHPVWKIVKYPVGYTLKFFEVIFVY